jgi:hypothetical protein
MAASQPPISGSCGAKATKRDIPMLNKTKIVLAAALVIGTASTALAGGFVEPGSMDGVNPAYHPRWFPNYPGVDNAPSGDPNALPPCFDGAGQMYYPANNDCYAGAFGNAGNAYGFVPSRTHHKHHSPR